MREVKANVSKQVLREKQRLVTKILAAKGKHIDDELAKLYDEILFSNISMIEEGLDQMQKKTPVRKEQEQNQNGKENVVKNEGGQRHG